MPQRIKAVSQVRVGSRINTSVKRLSLGVLVVFLTCGYADGKERQVIEGNTLKDLDYGFELKRPSGKWVFFTEREVGNLNRDAVAGLYHPKKKIITVIVPEEAPDITVEDYANLLIENISIAHKNIISKKEIVFNKTSGYQFKLKGELDGLKLTYFFTLYSRDDFFFQVISWWLTEVVSKQPKEIAVIHSSFSFTPGSKPMVRQVEGPERLQGVGWRVENGLYENVIYGFRFQLPSSEWRFMGNVELKNTNLDAVLGLVHAKSGADAIIIPERVGAITEKEYEKAIIERFLQVNETRKYGERKVRIDGRELTEHTYEAVPVGNVDVDYSLVVVKGNRFGCQIMAYWFHSKQMQARPIISELYPGFTWITEDERKVLSKRLITGADIDRSVAGDECFRNHTYKNFPFGLTLQLPRGFWKHTIGTEATLQNRDASLIFENLEYGLHGTLVLEEAESFEAEEYHKVVLQAFELPSTSRTNVRNADGTLIWSTRFNSKEGDHEFTYHLATASKGDRHVQLLMVGFAENMKDTSRLEIEILGGLRLAASSEPEKGFLKDGSFVNYKLGFKVTPPNDDWRIKDTTPKPLHAVGSLVRIDIPKPKRFFFTGAVHSELDMRNFFPALIAESDAFKRSGLKLASEQSVTWLGRPSTQFLYESSFGRVKRQVEIVATNLGGTSYFVMVPKQNGSLPSVRPREVLELIQ